jgi:hypothetical protein
MASILKPQPLMPGFTASVGHLLCFLEYARNNTLTVVQNCTAAQLDFIAEDDGNSPGTLLRHIAALEFQFQQVTFFNKHLTKAEMDKWYGAFAPLLSVNHVKKQHLDYYIELLSQQRAATISILKNKTDEWLLADNQLLPKANNLFFWYHLAEDELSHTGQIKLILKKEAKISTNTTQLSVHQT